MTNVNSHSPEALTDDRAMAIRVQPLHPAWRPQFADDIQQPGGYYPAGAVDKAILAIPAHYYRTSRSLIVNATGRREHVVRTRRQGRGNVLRMHEVIRRQYHHRASTATRQGHSRVVLRAQWPVVCPYVFYVVPSHQLQVIRIRNSGNNSPQRHGMIDPLFGQRSPTVKAGTEDDC